MAGPDVVRQTSTAAPLLGATCPEGSRLQEFLGPIAPGGRSRCAGQEPLCWDGRRHCCGWKVPLRGMTGHGCWEQQEPLRLAGRAAAQGRQEPLRWAAAGVVVGGRSHAGGRSCRSHALVKCIMCPASCASRNPRWGPVKLWLEVKGRIRGFSRGVPSEGAGKMRVEKGFGSGRCTICLGGS